MFESRHEEPMSPQDARSLQATENLWFEIEYKYGLLSIEEVSRNCKNSETNAVDYLNEDSQVIRVFRSGSLRFPGYQFDSEGEVLQNIKELVEESRKINLDEEELALWMMGRRRSLNSKAPVECLDNLEALIFSFNATFNVEW